MTQRDPSKQLAKEIADLRKELRSNSSSSQMRFRAIQGGAIPVFGTDGTQTGSVGVLPDGTTGFQVVTGPKPVAPSNPIVFPLVGGLEIAWDGKTFNGSPLPGDFRCVEVHASPFSVYTPDETTLRVNLMAPGSAVVQLPAQPWTVVFVIRTTAGMLSDPSLGATETPEHSPSATEITDARSAAEAAQEAANDANAKALEAVGIAADKGKVYAQDDAPEGDPFGLWIDTDDQNKPYTWNGSTWVLVRDAGVTTALQAADQAIAAAGDAQAAADGKVRSFFQDNAPTGMVAGDVGDLWFDTNDANKLYRWSGTAWVASDDTRISAAVTAASTASSAAAAAQAAADRAMAAAVNVIPDPSFEAGALTPTGVWSVDSTVARTGNKSWKCVGGTTASQLLAVNVPVKPGETWRARAWRRSTADYDGTSNNGKLRLQANARAGGTNGVIPSSWGAGDGTTWVLREIVYTVPSDGSILSVNLSVVNDHKNGILWIDDVELTNITEAKAAADAAATALGVANTKITTYYNDNPPAATGLTTGDLWVDTNDANKLWRWSGSAWVVVRDTGIQAAADAAAAAQERADDAHDVATSATSKADQALINAATAQTAANGKNKVFYRASTNPPPSPIILDDLWFKTDLGNQPFRWTGTAWVAATFGDQALSGLNVGKLTAGQIAAGQRIVAGETTGTHAEMAADGFRVYRDDPFDGVPDVVGRMGTSGDFAGGGADVNGRLTWSIDDTGAMNGRTANFREDIVVNGRSLTDLLSSGSTGRQVGRYATPIYGMEPGTGGIRSEIGVAQFTFPVVAGRNYLIRCDGPTWYANNGGEVVLRLRRRIGTPTENTPVYVSDIQFGQWFKSGMVNGMWQTGIGGPLVNTLVADVTGNCTVLVSLECKNGDVAKIPDGTFVIFEAYDMGPQSQPGTAGQQTNGGGQLYLGAPPPAPPTPMTQRVWESAPAGSETFRGTGVIRTDTAGSIVQGWDPSGFNGDGKGYMWWNLPNITGTVDRVELYLYSSHWYYNSGGTAIVNWTASGGGVGFPGKAGADQFIGGFPKPGGKWFDLPADWRATLRTGATPYRFRGITLGPSGGSNLAYYGRFPASSARLRITYTQ